MTTRDELTRERLIIAMAKARDSEALGVSTPDRALALMESYGVEADAVLDLLAKQRNHWTDDGDLVVEQKTLFRQVGWRGHAGGFFSMYDDPARNMNPIGFSPVYEQIATWKNGGWDD